MKEVIEKIEKKKKELEQKFDALTEQIKEKIKVIEKIREEIVIFQDEQKKLQGEYRALIELEKSLEEEQTDGN
jgi:peptidoglycan hydrolase CwlO-like protein